MELLYTISTSFFSFLLVALLFIVVQFGPASIIWCLVMLYFETENLKPSKMANTILAIVMIGVSVLMLPFSVDTLKYTWNGFFGPEPEPTVIVKQEIRRYKLLDMNPPKHFYVDLEDVQTHQVYEHRYVSKHCNNWRDNKIGDSYNITVITKQKDGRTWMEFQSMYGVFC